jgi:hypothetical protein
MFHEKGHHSLNLESRDIFCDSTKDMHYHFADYIRKFLHQSLAPSREGYSVFYRFRDQIGRHVTAEYYPASCS